MVLLFFDKCTCSNKQKNGWDKEEFYNLLVQNINQIANSDIKIPYLREASAHPFWCFLGPKNWVHIRIDGALDAHAKSETTISLSVGS